MTFVIYSGLDVIGQYTLRLFQLDLEHKSKECQFTLTERLLLISASYNIVLNIFPERIVLTKNSEV